MALTDAYPGIRPGTQFTPLWQRFLDSLRTSGVMVDPTQSGGYANRTIRGTGTPSMHAFDRAYDVNWRANPEASTYNGPQLAYDMYGEDARQPTTQIHPDIARDLASRYGMRWGGDFRPIPDPMHFEFRGPTPPVQGRGLTAFAGMTPPMRGPATAGVGLLAGGAESAQEPPFPPGAPLPGGMTIPPLEAPQAQEQPLGSNLLGLGRGILDWFSRPTPPGASGPPTPPPTLAAPSPSMSAPMGMPPMSASGGIGSDAVAAPVAPSTMVPPFATATQPEPIDADAIMTGAINAQAAREETERNRPGYFERLMTNPAFLAGLSILGTAPGGNWGPAGAQAVTQAMRSRREDTEYRRREQQRRTMDRVWSEAFPGGQPNMQHPLLAGQTPQVAAMIHSMGPEAALPLLARTAMERRQLEFKTVGDQAFLFDPRTGATLPVPGTSPRVPEAVRTRALQVNQAFQAISPELDRFAALVERSGWTFGNNAERDAVQQSRTNLLLQIKELFNLGALQKPDMDIMERLLIETDPGFWSNNPVTAQNPASRVRSAMRQLRQKLQELRDRAVEAAGRQPVQAEPASPTANDPLGIR